MAARSSDCSQRPSPRDFGRSNLAVTSRIHRRIMSCRECQGRRRLGLRLLVKVHSSPHGGPQAVAAPHSGASGGATDEPKKDDSAEKKDEAKDGKEGQEQNFNFHAQTTITSQGDPGFPAQYSGPNSLNSGGERQGTVTADLFFGVRVGAGPKYMPMP